MFDGVYVALVTPMHADKSIDFDALNTLIDNCISAKVAGLCVLGSTGEVTALTMAEKLQLIERCVDKLQNTNLKLIVGTGSNNTQNTIEFTLKAASYAIDACMLITPYYVRPTQEGLKQHFTMVANAVPHMPIILYNVPTRTGCDLLPVTIAAMQHIENIVAIKEATGDVLRVSAINALAPNRFKLLSGDDQTVVDFMLLGGHGVISVVANIIPSTIVKLIQLAANKQDEHAYLLDSNLTALYEAAFVESNPIAVKWLLHLLGIMQPYLRLPLTTLSDTYHKFALQALRDITEVALDKIVIIDTEKVLTYE